MPMLTFLQQKKFSMTFLFSKDLLLLCLSKWYESIQNRFSSSETSFILLKIPNSADAFKMIEYIVGTR